MSNWSSALNSAFNRMISNSIERIAKAGLVALRKVVNDAGFSRSEYLKNYELFVHIDGNLIIYEIVLDLEAIETEDEVSMEILEDQNKIIEEKLNKASTKSYRMTMRGVQGLTDARSPALDRRSPATDARTPATDARTTATDRLFKKELLNAAPRSAGIGRGGKLRLSFSRSIREVERQRKNEQTQKVENVQEIRMPDGKFEGIVKEFIDELNKIIANEWADEFLKIVKNYA